MRVLVSGTLKINAMVGPLTREQAVLEIQLFQSCAARRKLLEVKAGIRQLQDLEVARKQAQVMCVLYVENVPKGGMDITRHRDLLKTRCISCQVLIFLGRSHN